MQPARSAGFSRWATTKSVLRAVGRCSEKPDAETGSREARHFPTSFRRNGHAWAGQTHLSPLFTVSREFSRERRRNPPSSTGDSPRDTDRTDILEEPPYVDVAASAMLNRNFPPRMPPVFRLAPTSRSSWRNVPEDTPSECRRRRIRCCSSTLRPPFLPDAQRDSGGRPFQHA